MRYALNSAEIVVGLDLGSTKVTAVVGEVDADCIRILGAGTVPCRGLRKGVVSNIEYTVRAIREAIDAAENMAGVQISTVYAGVAGSHVRSHVSDGVCAIAGREVTRADVERVLEGARAIPVDADRMLLHALAREYVVDNQDGIRDPVGMSGVRLQARVNLITAAASCVQNVVRCVERCDLEVAEMVLQPLAAADAVLSDDEKEIGVAVIDIGGGTSDLVLYADGGIAHVSVIPAGGNNITADLAAGLRTPMGEAERLKCNQGCALGRMIGEDEEVEVPGVRGHGSRRVARRLLGDIVEPRVEEIFAEARRRIEELGLLEQMASGCVLTGGAALMEGMVECAEEVLGMPVRLGMPEGIDGMVQLVQAPRFAAAVGLVRYGAQALSDASLRERERGAIAPAPVREAPRDAARGRGLIDWLRAAF